MAWRSSGSTNEALINNLVANGLIEDDRVKEAMLKQHLSSFVAYDDLTKDIEFNQVDRAHYAPRNHYEDSPQPIGHQATISAPHMHASACSSLLPFLRPNSRVLDVGSGSGYLTAVLAQLVKPAGSVVGIDHVGPLVALAEANMRKSEEGQLMLASDQVRFVVGDGRKGWAEGAPYDAIHVGAAAAEHHQELVDQLKAPGRLFVPVHEGALQYIFVVDKLEDGRVERKKLYGVRYVPLTNAPSERK